VSAVTELIERIEERDRQIRLRHEYWRDGFAAADRLHADDYERGYAAAIADIKRSEHELFKAEEKLATKWIVRGQLRTRQTFDKPHPTDYQGGPLPLEGPAGMVWLGGAAVHHHPPCIAACHRYKPGWYAPGVAAAILRRLPKGDYTETIDQLSAMAAEGGEAA
jgi:hypothetical protein